MMEWQVYLARNKETGEEVVIKMIERGPAVSKHVESELLIHRCGRLLPSFMGVGWGGG